MEQIKHKAQYYEYLIVIDFECQCTYNNSSEMEVQEIIEFPAYIIDCKNKKILENYFHYYIKPSVYPILTDFCKELTGIQQEQVDNGISLSDALNKFDEFLKETNILNSKFTIVTDGHCDVRIFLKREALFKNISYPNYLKSYIDLKAVYTRFTKNSKCGLRRMLTHFNLYYEGRLHSGIDDTKNIARVALQLVENNCQFTIADTIFLNVVEKEQKLDITLPPLSYFDMAGLPDMG